MKLDRNGYGSFSFINDGQRERQQAHRMAWQLYLGPIPAHLAVLHKCDNPRCVNPEHLFLGTNEDNRADCVAKDRQAKGSRMGAAKLTENMVSEILASELPRHILADAYHVSKTAIALIKRRETWKHVCPHDLKRKEP